MYKADSSLCDEVIKIMMIIVSRLTVRRHNMGMCGDTLHPYGQGMLGDCMSKLKKVLYLGKCLCRTDCSFQRHALLNLAETALRDQNGLSGMSSRVCAVGSMWCCKCTLHCQHMLHHLWAWYAAMTAYDGTLMWALTKLQVLTLITIPSCQRPKMNSPSDEYFSRFSMIRENLLCCGSIHDVSYFQIQNGLECFLGRGW